MLFGREEHILPYPGAAKRNPGYYTIHIKEMRMMLLLKLPRCKQRGSFNLSE